MPSSLLFEYLETLFDASDIARGTTYFCRGHVISIQWSKNGKRIDALVHGSNVEPYRVSFQFQNWKNIGSLRLFPVSRTPALASMPMLCCWLYASGNGSPGNRTKSKQAAPAWGRCGSCWYKP